MTNIYDCTVHQINGKSLELGMQLMIVIPSRLPTLRSTSSDLDLCLSLVCKAPIPLPSKLEYSA